jgi:glucose-fructose oxidoreductase
MTENVTRRSFLHSASSGFLAAGLASSLASAADPQQSGDPGRKIGFAFVGIGRFSLGELLPAVKQSKLCRAAALVSGDLDKAKKTAQQHGIPESSCYTYDTYERLAENKDVDAAFIVLPNSMHREYTERGAKIGKHVLCEKPMATSSADCGAMIDACKTANRKLMIGYCVRYGPYNRAAIQLCRDKAIGRISVINADAGFPLHNPDEWRLNKKLAGGGPLLDIGIYGLNATRFLTGEEPIEVSGLMFQPKDDPAFKDVEASTVFQLKFPSGALANCSTSYNYPFVNRYRVMGSDGWLELDPATSYRGTQMRGFLPGKGMQTMQFEAVNHYAAEMDHFADCILNDKQPLTPGEEGLADLRVMEAIYESAASGKTIRMS